ncbi:MAG: hypothetical protein U9R11_02690 [Chloroflexota bacterium]|nr:hypothetical protein [Chloroflexota bacterium]
MPKLAGNAMRRSAAPLDAEVIDNFPGLYPTEDWRAYYWVVTERGELVDTKVTIRLPRGYADVCPKVELGQNGCIYRVRRWGLACYPSLLEEIGFDPTPLLTHDRERFPGGDGQEILHVMINATHFDLPGHFIIASEQYPLLLFDPEGTLKGSHTKWCTYMGALAWLASDGVVNADFELLRTTNQRLYREAIGYLLSALRKRRGKH